MTEEEFLGRWFTAVTKPQLADYNAKMDVARAYRGSPRWDRERAKAQQEFHEATNEARKLYEMALSEMQTFGDVGEALDAEMTAYERRERVFAQAAE